MKSSLFATSILGLAFVGLWYFGGGAQSLPMARGDDSSPRVAAPLAHENLSVYFVHGRDTVPNTKLMSLQEALERELAVVHETSDVNTLAVENRSPDCELFIQSGDIVKGGKQDRMAATDMLLPPKSGLVPLPAHCVEQGRWTNRGSEDARKFHTSANFAAGKGIMYANQQFQQDAVWKSVKENQDKLSANLQTNANADASPTSLQLTLEAPAVKAKVAEYEAALKAAAENRDDIIGVVFVVNGQVTGAEVYGSNALFRKAWPKLLNAAAVEAVAEQTDKPTASAPSAREVERFLASAANPEPTGINDTPANSLRRTQTLTNSPPLLVNLRARSELNRPRMTGNANEEVFQTEGRVLQVSGQQAANPAPNTPQPPDRVGRVVVEGNTVTGNRVQLNQLWTPLNSPGGQAGYITQQSPPANPAGNRLNSNRTENRSTLMVESRDPARANAVIHRSYVKK